MTLEDDFPGLRGTEYRVTSPVDLNYNCLAWAMDDNSQWWEPSDAGFWPKGVDRQFTLKAYRAMLAGFGFEPCESQDLESSTDKIALFAADGEISHVSRQVSSGMWTSKLGSDVDLEHELTALEGAILGNVVEVFARAK